MLPTFPKIIELRREANEAAVKAKVSQMAPQFGMIGHNVQFEGSGHSIIRADDTVDHTEMAAVSAEMRVPIGSALHDFTLQVVDTYLTGAARQMAEGMSKHFFEVIDRGTREAGMVVDGKGGPITEDLILEVFEKMEHTFNDDGSWNAPVILAGQDMIDKMLANVGTPAGNAKLAELLERKRDDFRRRQAGRVLAG